MLPRSEELGGHLRPLEFWQAKTTNSLLRCRGAASPYSPARTQCRLRHNLTQVSQGVLHQHMLCTLCYKTFGTSRLLLLVGSHQQQRRGGLIANNLGIAHHGK